MRKKWAIPDAVLTPILSSLQRELKKCCDSFITYDWDRVKEGCGADYGSVPLDDIRRQSINLRKRGVVGAVRGIGASKTPALSKEYRDALKRPEFRAYFDVLKIMFSNRCAICNTGGKLEPHHRTYENLGNEEGFDCIPVCQKCHKVCDVRRRRQAGRGE